MKPSQAKQIARGTPEKFERAEKKEKDNVIYEDDVSEDRPNIMRSTSWRELGVEQYDMQRRITRSTEDQVRADFIDFNTMDKVRVICRFRPSNVREQREEKTQSLEHTDPEIQGGRVTVVRADAGKRKRDKNKSYYLDNIISWTSSQNRCFRVIGFPMVESVLSGYNATIFAYGQTGSGKTYTMMGPEGNVYSPDRIGLIQRAISMLFKTLGNRRDNKHDNNHIESYSVKVQFVQIYKEKLHDLLNPRQGTNLRIRYDAKTDAPYVENITQNVVHQTKEVLSLLRVAISNRVTDKTKMNAVSSRSHLVMTIIVQQNKPDGTKIASKLNFGDLAGSESVRKTDVKLGSKQFQELRAINLSLTALTTVINDIVNGRKAAFRASKLTHLLQDSLGGNTKTTIVVCASPHVFNRDETMRTLTFAQQAKTVKNKAKINKEYTNDQLHRIIKELEAENQKLKTQVAKLNSKQKLGLISQESVGQSPDQLKSNKEYQRLTQEMQKLQADITAQAEAKEKELKEANERLRTKKVEMEGQSEQLAKLQSSLNEAEGNVEKAHAEGKAQEDLIAELKRKLETAEKKNIDLNQTIADLEEESKEQSDQIIQQTEDIAGLKTSLEMKDEDITQKEFMVDELRKQLVNVRKQLLREKKEKEAERHKRNLTEANLKNLKGQIDMAQAKDRQAAQARTSLLRETRNAKTDLFKTQLELEKTKQNLDAAKVNAEVAQENLRQMTAQEILEKHNLDQGVLEGIEHDLGHILTQWRGRHKKKSKKLPPNPNTTIALQVRSVIAFFNVAMKKLDGFEKAEKSATLAPKKKTGKKKDIEIRRLKTKCNELNDSLRAARKKRDEYKEELDRLQEQQDLAAADAENQDEQLRYLDDVTSATLRGEDPENGLRKEDLQLGDLYSANFSEDEAEDESAAQAVKDALARQRHSIADGGWRQALETGDAVDALDMTDLWYAASILDIKNDDAGDKVLVHYRGFPSKYDEWIGRFDPRIAQFGSKAKGGAESGGTEGHPLKVEGNKGGKKFVKAGYVQKENHQQGFLKNSSAWKSRYAVLFENAILRIYANEKTEQSITAINMCLVRSIQMDKADYRQKLFEFVLIEANRNIRFRVSSHEEMNAWILALKNVRLKVIDQVTQSQLARFENDPSKKDKTNRVRRRSRAVLLSDSQAEILAQQDSTSKLEQPTGPAMDLHSGFVWKMGGSVRTWHKRFFILFNNYTIRYYVNKVDPHSTTAKPKGTVDIWGVQEVQDLTEEERKSFKLPKECTCGMKLITAHRTWVFGMNSDESLKTWKLKIAENSIFASYDEQASQDLAKSKQGKKRFSLSSKMGDMANLLLGHGPKLEDMGSSGPVDDLDANSSMSALSPGVDREPPAKANTRESRKKEDPSARESVRLDSAKLQQDLATDL